MGEDLRGYYIHYNARDTIGASKKIDMQLEAFASHYDIEEINIRLKSKSYVRNAVALLPFGSLTWDFGSALDKIKDPDFLYIRKNLYDRRQYLF
nr:hypothetical protein [Lachnospiraceae bacterium]